MRQTMMQYLFVLVAWIQVHAAFSNQVSTDVQLESPDTLAAAAADSTSASLMRKEQDSTQEDSEQHIDQNHGPGRRGSFWESPENSKERNIVVVAAHGGMVAQRLPKLDGKLDAALVWAHPASSLSALAVASKPKRWEPCKDTEDSCTFNLVVSSSRFSNWHLQAHGCRNMTFNFRDCETTSDQGKECVKSGAASGLGHIGVRVLKDSSGQTVDYGSCCIAGQLDTLSPDSTVQCGNEAPLPVGTDFLSTCNGGVTKIDGTVSVTKGGSEPITGGSDVTTAPSTTASSSGVTTAPPSSGVATLWKKILPSSVWEYFVALSEKDETMPLKMTCFAMALVAVIISCFLISRHWKLGADISGDMFSLHPSSSMFIGMLWALPLFGILASLDLFVPEMGAAWQFCESLLLVATFRKMPDVLVQVAGGRLQLQRSLQASGQVEAVQIFTHFPFSWMQWLGEDPEVPQLSDISGLQRGVVILCTLLPFFTFVDMCLSFETAIKLLAIHPHPRLAIAVPGILTFVRFMSLACLLLGLATLSALKVLLEVLSPASFKKMNLAVKVIYCQSFLVGLRLLPMLCRFGHFTPLQWTVLFKEEGLARSVTACVATLFVSVMACWAFPADKQHYPELVSAAACSDATGSQTTKKMSKPVLEPVMFCPFCGSGDLELEADNCSSEGAACRRCCARHVPLSLVVRRGAIDTTSDLAASGSAEGAAAASSSEDISKFSQEDFEAYLESARARTADVVKLAALQD